MSVGFADMPNQPGLAKEDADSTREQSGELTPVQGLQVQGEPSPPVLRDAGELNSVASPVPPSLTPPPMWAWGTTQLVSLHDKVADGKDVPVAKQNNADTNELGAIDLSIFDKLAQAADDAVFRVIPNSLNHAVNESKDAKNEPIAVVGEVLLDKNEINCDGVSSVDGNGNNARVSTAMTISMKVSMTIDHAGRKASIAITGRKRKNEAPSTCGGPLVKRQCSWVFHL